MTSQLEVERKYSLNSGQVVPSLAAIAALGPAETFNMVATYYDAPDYRLTRAKQVIRRRTGGPDEGWHLKLPGTEADQRIEFHEPLGGLLVPAKFRQLVAATLQDAAVIPIAVLRTRRTVQQLLAADGTALAELCQDEVRSSVQGIELSWREVEVELLAGSNRLLDQVEQVLAASGIRRAEVGSKIARALARGLAAAERADSSAGAAVLGYLALQLGVIQSLTDAVRLDAPDSVHRSRVATRRIRSTLRSYGDLFSPGSLRALRSELRWHAEELGLPRDAEVLQARLLAQAEQADFTGREVIIDRIRSSLAAAHAAAHDQLVASMATQRYEALQVELARLLAEPRWSRLADEPGRVVLPGLLERTVDRVRELASHAAARPQDLTRWHEVRKAAKRARYGAELLVPVLGAPAETIRARWEAVTEALGQVQDAVVAQQMIGELAWSAVADGLPRLPFDELRHLEDGLLRAALTQGRIALVEALD